MTDITIMPIVYGALAGAFWAFLNYASKVIDPTKPEQLSDFDIIQIIVTAVFGAIIGLAMALSGTSISQQDVIVQMTLYSPIIAIVQMYAKAIWRKFKGQNPT